jgi:lipopolysaccharide assembly outer membrane protein LptD (OstA)
MLISVANCFSQDTLSAKTKQDTSALPLIKGGLKGISDSNSAIKSKVIYSARDSIRFDIEAQKVFLFGDAQVKYESMQLKAAYIEFDMLRNTVFARGARDSCGNAITDSTGMPIGEPVFSDGEKSFDAKELTYNFQTKKGKIKNVTTQEGEAFIHANDAKKDTGEIYYIKNGRYTTCNLNHPHFYIKSTKLKVIPDDKIISGPAYMVIADVPTPLAIPFGVFPNKKGRKSGVLVPSYGESELGYFLKDGGYYFGLSDYFDLALRGDIYSKGSYNIRTNTHYTKRYKYDGYLGLNFSDIKISEKEFPDFRDTKDFFVRWQHTQDAKSNPTSRFSANVNAGSRTYQKLNSYSSGDYLSNTFQSNIAWSKSWQGKPYNLSMNASHSQNTILKTVDVTFPEAAFTVSRLYPFKRKEPRILGGKPKWYEKIGTNFTVNTKNQISTYDSLLLKESSLKKFRNGIKATIPISTSMNLGPLIISPSFNLNNLGYFQSIKKRYSPDNNTVITDTLSGFKYAYDYSTALSLNTKLYGMFLFKHSKVKAIRHVLTPNVSLSYRPDFSEKQYGFYQTVQINSFGNQQLYSIFQNGIYGSPPSGKSALVTFSLNNTLEMKLRPSKNDTSSHDRKVSLLDVFNISSSYNIAAEHFKWSVINISGRTKVFKVWDITFNAIIDPYRYDASLGRRIEKFEFNRSGNIGRLTSASFALSTNLNRSSPGSKGSNKSAPANGRAGDKGQNQDELSYILSHPDYYVDFSVPWNLSVYYNLTYSKPALSDTIIQSFTFSGDIKITEKWKIGFHSGFDFVKGNFTFTSFDVYRDLHCWEMRFNWIPFGFRKSYMLTIGVKSSVLQDLKLLRKRDWYDYN